MSRMQGRGRRFWITRITETDWVIVAESIRDRDEIDVVSEHYENRHDAIAAKRKVEKRQDLLLSEGLP